MDRATAAVLGPQRFDPRMKFACCRNLDLRALVSSQTTDDVERLRKWPWFLQQLVARGWIRAPQRPHASVTRCTACGRQHHRLHAYVRTLQPGKFHVG